MGRYIAGTCVLLEHGHERQVGSLAYRDDWLGGYMISPTEREGEREEREACSGEGGGGPEVLLLRLLPNLLLRCGVDTYYLQVDGTWPTAASCWVPENSGDGVKTSGNEEQLFFREGEKGECEGEG